MKAVVCAADELAKGHMRPAKLGPFPIVVVRTPDGSLFALLDKCLHQGGPLSRGRLGATSAGSEDVDDYRFERSGEILRCPWHGWEFDLATGRSVFDPDRTRVKSYPVEVEELHAETYPVEIERDQVVVILT